MKRTIFRDKHFYILLAFFIVCTLFYYFGELVSFFGWDALRWDIFYTVHDPHRMLFLVPILYSSYYYRSRGALLANVISLFIFLPRAFFISPYPDATLRMVVFMIVAIVISMLSVFIFNERDKRNKSIEALKQSEEKYRNILNQMYDAYYEVDLAGNFTFVNDAACLNLGYSSEELIGHNFQIALSENDAKTVFEAYHAVYASGEPNKGFAFEVTRKDGTTGYAESSVSLLKNERGKIIGFRSISRDVTERKRIEHQAKERMKELMAFYSVSELTMRKDITLDNLYGEVTNILPTSWQYPEIAYARVVIGDGEYRTKNFTNSAWKQSAPIKVNGTEVGRIDVGYLEERPELDEGPFLKEERRLIDAIAERIGHITERKQAEEALYESEAALTSVFNVVGTGILVIESETQTILEVNLTASKMIGRTKEEMVGHICHSFVCPAEVGKCPVKDLGQAIDNSERKIICADGQTRSILKSVSPLTIKGRQCYLESFIDITERKNMEQKLEELATHDYLTGLPNRVLLTDRFNMAAALSQRNKARLAVMSLDLDKFKIINDTLGHQAGDQVLKTISARLTSLLRASDTIARVGGDEFVLVMLETGRREDATVIAQKILDAFAEPLPIDGHQVHLSTSVGIAIYPEEAQDLETLIKKSDAAMYHSKGHGRNRFKFFGDGDVLIGGDHKSGPPVRG